MKLIYIGHSCFRVESEGYSVILDPYQDGSVPGYRPVREEADQVLCSHGHRDHGAAECVTLHRGGTSPFTVEALPSWHDDRQGALRGENTIHILDDGRCRIAHLGDLGCDLTAEQKDRLRGLTALLLPVGGYYTIDAVQASRLADELAPTVVIPMHYCGEGFGYDVIGPVNAFTDLRGDVTAYPGSVLELTPGTAKQTAVLTPRNLQP